ncbi:6-phosphogluconolactonase [Leptospira sp. WS39.C2]
MAINLVTFNSSEIWTNESLDFFERTILEELTDSIDGELHIILSGGNTPIPIYKRFSELDLPWDKFHFWLADERCVPFAHEDRTEPVIKNVLGSYITSLSKFHSIPEKEPITAAKSMDQVLKAIPKFHFAFLGIGEDGHTASLFPGYQLEDNSNDLDMIPIFESPKPPRERVSLSVKCINRSNHILFLTKGNGKMEILKEVMNGAELPVNLVRGKKSSQIYFCTE